MDTEYLQYSLNIGHEWQEVEPASTDYTVLVDGENLHANSTSFDKTADIGYISGVNCPIAIDHISKIAYRSVHKPINETLDNPDGVFDKYKVEIRSFDLSGRDSSLITTLTDGLDCYWLLELLPTQSKLLALLSDHKQPSQSYLGTIDLTSGEVTQALLPDAAFFPVALSLEREQVVFSGRHGGAILINFKGESVSILEPGPIYNLEGADFIGKNDIVLGGNGVHIWDPEQGTIETLVAQGSYPVSNSAGQIWFNASDGAVSYFDLQERVITPVVALTGLDLNETMYAQPVVFSLDKRMALARLTGKRKLSREELTQKEKLYKQNKLNVPEFESYYHVHLFCVMDTQERKLWKYPGYAHNVALVRGKYYDV